MTWPVKGSLRVRSVLMGCKPVDATHTVGNLGPVLSILERKARTE